LRKKSRACGIPNHSFSTRRPFRTPEAQVKHPAIAIAARARAGGLNLTPATSLIAPSNYQQAVSLIVNTDNRGVGLRVGLQGLTSAANWIANWPHPVHQTDLLVDLGNSMITVAALGNVVIGQVFANLHQAGNWRTVTIIGTSMPDSFQGWLAGLRTIPRLEWSLWQSLSNAGLPYRIDYGDYATIPVNPAPGGIAWGFPISVRYTLDGEFLICRGVNTAGLGGIDMNPQLINHAQQIVGYPQRGPLASCWADTEIDTIAANSSGPGGLEHWVQLGVNRHVEMVRSVLP
jgi:hypothetical protein